MDSTTVIFGIGYNGRLAGTPTSPELVATLDWVVRCAPTGAGWQIYEASLTIAGGATTTLDLTTGLTSPLGESISGTPGKFLTIFAVLIEHDALSEATDGITAFGGASNDFQGVKAAGDKDTMIPGRFTAFGGPATDAGMTVDATHKNVAITNLAVSDDATVNVFILGRVAA